MDSPRASRNERPNPLVLNEADLTAFMDQSERDVVGGMTVALAEVLAELDAVVEKIGVRRRARPA